MKNTYLKYLIVSFIFLYSGTALTNNVTQLEWLDLIPEEHREKQLSYEQQYSLDDLPDVLSSEEDLQAEIDENLVNPETLQPRFAPVVKSLDKKQVRIPGYAVPMEVNSNGEITEFLLVPFFGACIHVPPPPANQIIHVISKKGVKISTLEDAIWVEGKLSVIKDTNEWADTGYKIMANKVTMYR